MAQVWLSFDEIQQVFGCDTADARKRVVANQWGRRRCTDGLVRAQVPSDVHGAKEEARRAILPHDSNCRRNTSERSSV